MRKTYIFFFFLFFFFFSLQTKASKDSLRLAEFETGNFSSSGFKNISLNYLTEYVWKAVEMNWQINSIEANFALVSKKNSFKASFLPRINMGQRYGKAIDLAYLENCGWQYQLESYLSFSPSYYFRVLYAYSASPFFANHQALIEWNKSFAKAWGMQISSYFYFWSFVLPGVSIGCEKYIENFWLNLKISSTFYDKKLFPSVQLGLRNYFRNPVNYLHLGFTYGNSPEYINYRPETPYLLGMDTYGTYLFWQQRLYKTLCLKATLAYRYEEFRPAEFRNVLSGHLGLSLYFR